MWSTAVSSFSVTLFRNQDKIFRLLVASLVPACLKCFFLFFLLCMDSRLQVFFFENYFLKGVGGFFSKWDYFFYFGEGWK